MNAVSRVALRSTAVAPRVRQLLCSSFDAAFSSLAKKALKKKFHRRKVWRAERSLCKNVHRM
jgi:hypothetical protein